MSRMSAVAAQTCPVAGCVNGPAAHATYADCVSWAEVWATLAWMGNVEAIRRVTA